MVLDVALSLGFRPSGYFNPDKSDADPYELNFCGFEKDVDVEKIVRDAYLFPALGSNAIRKKLMTNPKFASLNFAVLAAPSAVISKLSIIEKGTLIAPSAVVQSKARIGRGSIVNTGVIVEHECQLGDFVHVAPGAVLAGNVTIGEIGFIGANATIKEGVTIGKGAVIGAGAVVICDVPAGETWVGNPAKKLR